MKGPIGKETICDVRWKGSVEWDGPEALFDIDYVLYALFGTHPLYGSCVPLYIGRTEVDIGSRLAGHREWMNDEYDVMRVKVASVGAFDSVEAWWNAYDAEEHYKKADARLVAEVESLLIYAHQPTYNTQSKSGVISDCRPLRILNTGKLGSFFPEISSAYYIDS